MTGVLLLVTGAASAGLAILGARWALGFLALLGVLAVPVGRTLPDVSASPSSYLSHPRTGPPLATATRPSRWVRAITWRSAPASLLARARTPSSCSPRLRANIYKTSRR